MQPLKSSKSFIDVPPDSDFSLQNLPYGIFSVGGERPRVGVAIGDQVLDLAVLEREGLLGDVHLPDEQTFSQHALNCFMAAGRPVWRAVRETLQALLHADTPTLRDDDDLRRRALLPMQEVRLHLPVEIGDYTDFYSSREHAANVGTMLRGKDNALMPNWLHLPVAYHGRASSIILSGVDIHRPHGQIKREDSPAPVFTPSRSMDFELEVGVFVGTGNPLGQPIPVNTAADHLFGMVLVNDWSARDIQTWEYQPLGPFLAKNLATSISPWVVPMEALEPFRCAGPAQDPQPLPYLQSRENRAYDIQLEVSLQSARMSQAMLIARSNMRYLYWNVNQQVAHHTINGCNLRTGDLLASGTISGPEPGSYGSMLELTWRGAHPLTLPSGELRRFLEDFDRVTFHGWCQGEGYRVGFGEVTGRLLPPVPLQL